MSVSWTVRIVGGKGKELGTRDHTGFSTKHEAYEFALTHRGSNLIVRDWHTYIIYGA